MGILDSNLKKKKDYKLLLNGNNFLKFYELITEFFSQSLETINMQPWGGIN